MRGAAPRAAAGAKRGGAASASMVAYHGRMEHSRPTRLTRSQDHILGGVAAGLAEYLDIDPTLVRVAWVLAVVFGLPLAILGYVILWIIMPSPEAGRAEGGPVATEGAAGKEGMRPSADEESRRDNGALLLGIVLIVVGALFLLPDGDFLPWFGWRLIHLAWPIALILVGLLLLARSSRNSE